MYLDKDINFYNARRKHLKEKMRKKKDEFFSPELLKSNKNSKRMITSPMVYKKGHIFEEPTMVRKVSSLSFRKSQESLSPESKKKDTTNIDSNNDNNNNGTISLAVNNGMKNDLMNEDNISIHSRCTLSSKKMSQLNSKLKNFACEDVKSRAEEGRKSFEGGVLTDESMSVV